MTTELQKMLAGELYNALDPQLSSMRLNARRLSRLYNQSIEGEFATRATILKELFGKVGKNPVIEPPFFCDYGSNIFAGKNLFMNFSCVVLDCGEVHFGDNVFCGPNVQVYTATHPLDPILRSKGQEAAKTIRIGNDVWLGGSCVICPGVSIGEGTTIGAGSVVTKDIPAQVFAAGNPCRVIRELK